MNIEFKDKCPAKDNCNISQYCLCGNFGEGETIEVERLRYPYAPLYVSSMIEGESYWACTVNEEKK